MNVFLKKVAATFDKKLSAYRKKRTNNPREESITKELLWRAYHWGLKMTLSQRTIKRTLWLRDLKKNLKKTLRNLKRTLSLDTLKRTLSMRTLRSFSTLDNFYATNFFFHFLVIVYDRVGDGEKFSCKKFGLGSTRFDTTAN